MDSHHTLACWLTYKSSYLCMLHRCTPVKHHCRSNAYIDKDMKLLAVCKREDFSGLPVPHAVIPLPYTGSQEALESEVYAQLNARIQL